MNAYAPYFETAMMYNSRNALDALSGPGGYAKALDTVSEPIPSRIAMFNNDIPLVKSVHRVEIEVAAWKDGVIRTPWTVKEPNDGEAD